MCKVPVIFEDFNET